MSGAFALRNIAAVNYYLYNQDFRLDGPGNTVFLGGNGSGKSVLLDAIQIVMTGLNKNYLDLNGRIAEGRAPNRRTVREACLGLLDDGLGYEREECVTYIALGFETLDGKKRCTAGVAIEARATSTEETVLGLFVVDGEILTQKDFVHEDPDGYVEKKWENFRDEQNRKKRQIETFQRQNNKAFLRRLYSIINANARGTQLDPDRARAAMRQALSFDIDDIKNVTDFVKKFLLDDLPIDVDTFQSRYATWRELQKEIARVEAEIKAVDGIVAQCLRVMTDQFNTRLWAYGAQRAEYDRLQEILARQAREVAGMQEELDEINAFKPIRQDTIEGLRRRIEAVRRQIDGTPAYEQLKSARSALEAHEGTRKVKSMEAAPVLKALEGLRRAALHLRFPQASFPAVAAFAESRLSPKLLDASAPLWPRDAQAIAATIRSAPNFGECVETLRKNYARASSEQARLEQRANDIDEQLTRLEGGGRGLSRDTEEFLRDLSASGIEAATLSEVADIAPHLSTWRGIVEAILGDWCDAIIAPPAQMDEAFRHFDVHYRGSRVKLIQTEAEDTPVLRPGSLAEAVETDDIYARGFLNARLSGIKRAQSADDIRRGDRAASEDGKFAHGRGIEYRRLDAIPKLGRAARKDQIAILTASRRALDADLAAAMEAESAARAIYEAVVRAKTLIEEGKEATLQLFVEIGAADQAIAAQKDLVSALEASLPDELMAELKGLEEHLKEARTEEHEEGEKERALINKIGERKGGMNANRDSRERAAEAALNHIPDRALRAPIHSEAIGLERFMRRARAAYLEAAKEQPSKAHLRLHFDSQAKDKGPNQRGAVTRLVKAIEDYVHAAPDQYPGFEWTPAIHGEKTALLYDWAARRAKHLTETVLRRFSLQVDAAVEALVESMVHDFLARLRANIERVDRVKDELNKELKRTAFMGEVYQIRQSRDQAKDAVRDLIDRLDVIAPKANALMRASADPNDEDFARIKSLIDLLTTENPDDDAAHRRQLRDLADYRNYFRFSIDICNPENDFQKISDVDTRRGKASGGQLYLPYYICLGVAASAAYRNHLGGAQDAPPQSALLLMDEAFEKLDPVNIYKVIDFYKRLGLQLIMAAPKTHQALYQETFNTLISIIRDGREIAAAEQHFHEAAHAMLRDENPMHHPRAFFEERLNEERRGAAE